MQRPKGISVFNSLWVRSRGVDEQPVWKPLRAAFQERGVEVFMLDLPRDRSGVARLRERVWKSDQHVILHGLMAGELNALRPIFQDRRNFSLVLIDWWTSPYWATQLADYLIFHSYSGIATRLGLAGFVERRTYPLASWPQRRVRFELACCALRLPALAVWPLLDVFKWLQRRGDRVQPEQMLYFPLPIDAQSLPLKTERLEFDFANAGATSGYWLMRDAHASARLNFANLYSDRKRLIDAMLAYENRPFRIYDRRRDDRFMPWEEYCGIIRRSRYAIATGGLHEHSAIPKFFEYICQGTPVIGRGFPFEYPWMDQCLFTVEPGGLSADAFKRELERALDMNAQLRANCVKLREELLRLYDAGRLMEMLQGQLEGKPVPAGYLKENARQRPAGRTG
jgi:hypothetical protein